jgi:CBS domain-containing protein
MIVSDIMSREVEFLDPAATVQAAAELMGELDVGALPVGTETKLDGIVTDRDILYRVVARGLDPATTPIRDVLSRPVITCGEADTIQVAMDLMATNHIRRLPVLDPAGAVSGWITMADLSRRLLVDSTSLQSALLALTEAG